MEFEMVMDWMDLDEEEDRLKDEDDEDDEDDIDDEDDFEDDDFEDEDDFEDDEDFDDLADDEEDDDIEDDDLEEEDEDDLEEDEDDFEDAYAEDEYEDDDAYEDEEYEDEEDDEYEDDDYEDEEDEYEEYEDIYGDAADDYRSGRPRVYGNRTGRGRKGSGRYGKQSAFTRIVDFASRLTVTDYLLALTGVVVIAVGIVAGTMYVNAKSEEKSIAAFAEVGEGMEDIPVIGESGLLAVADAQANKAVAEELAALEEEEKQVDDETGKIAVALNLTSIQKDLKIKFTNKNSGKLIASVAFEVEVTPPSGKVYTLKDDDKDGIIYETKLAAGKYKVAITGPSNLDEYSFSTEAVTITVRDTIEYKKVDVADEIKSEAQVNAAVEDTAANNTVIESTNTDTVEWVESTKTLIDGSSKTEDVYDAVSRSNITDPATKTAAGFKLLSKRMTEEESGEGAEPTTSTETTTDPQPAQTSEAEEKSTPSTTTPTAAATETSSATATPSTAATATPTTSPTTSPTTVPATTSPSPSISPSPSVSPSISPSPSVTPSPTYNAKNDTTTNLKDNSGNQLYVKDSSGNYREAKYADYYNSSITFYKKSTKTTGEYRYTGWQTIDGSTYFFDKNGNKVTGKQVIQGAEYEFNDNGVLNTGSGHLGIDVSKWNGGIDWSAVKNSGVSYVIIRCGYRGSTTGALIEDPKFKTNIQGALNAGLKVGVYFFTQAVNEVEAVEEASMVLSLVKGYNISYPIFLDVESSGGRADSIGADTRTAVCKAFCQTIQNSGYKAGIYANKTWFTSYINTGSLTSYKIWLAQYAATPTYTKTKYDMWQYSSRGSVSGISGNVDMNISYLGY